MSNEIAHTARTERTGITLSRVGVAIAALVIVPVVVAVFGVFVAVAGLLAVLVVSAYLINVIAVGLVARVGSRRRERRADHNQDKRLAYGEASTGC